jgi:hypothetical protein
MSLAPAQATDSTAQQECHRPNQIPVIMGLFFDAKVDTKICQDSLALPFTGTATTSGRSTTSASGTTLALSAFFFLPMSIAATAA